MVAFIARMIEKQAKISTEKGIAKYKAYFVNTRIYEDYRADVDTILITDGYDEIVISE